MQSCIGRRFSEGEDRAAEILFCLCFDVFGWDKQTPPPPPSSNSGFSYLIFHLLSSANKCVKKCRGLVERAYSRVYEIAFLYAEHKLYSLSLPSLLEIVFYEGRNFQGRHWECSSDCMDTFRHFNYCNSLRVSGGHCVLYEKPHYMGYQYILSPGEYPDYHWWMGFNNCIRSCQMFPPVSQSNRQIELVAPSHPPTPRYTHLVHQKLLWIWMSITGFLMSFTDTHTGHSIKVSAARPTKETESAFKKNMTYPP